MKCSNCPRCASTINVKDAFCHTCGYILQERRVKPSVYSSPVSMVDSPELLALSPYQVTQWPVYLARSAMSLLKLAGLIFFTSACMHAI